MPDLDPAQSLRRTRRLATGLLVAMAVVFALATSQQQTYPWLSFVVAFAEAAMVGALADWFAVTALFRSPFGLPIPHTAIIPRNKDRIGDGLSDFLEHNFMTQEIVRDELRRVDFAGIAAGWLAEPANSRVVARQVLHAVPPLLRAVEDQDVQEFMQHRMAAALENRRVAPLIGELLSVLVAARHHQQLFDHLINFAANALEHNKDYIRWKVHEHSPRWLPKAIDERLYRRLLEALEGTLAEMRDDDSEWRLRFDNAVLSFLEQLRESPEYEEKLRRLAGDVLGHPLLRDLGVDVWRSLRTRLEEEANKQDSLLAVRLEQAVRTLAEELLRDERMSGKLNQWVRVVATQAVVSQREAIADLAARVIRTWDAETISRKLELQVGADLQYIRINGTLVGGLVGLTLHALVQLF